jgi:hypothetical protein
MRRSIQLLNGKWHDGSSPVTILALVAALATTAATASPAPLRAQGSAIRSGMEMAQLSFRSRVVVRIESWKAQPPAPQSFKEKKGPRCLPMGDILGAAILGRAGVDLVLRGGERMRARFASSCPGLDYYSGFYILPPRDGQICSDRDVVRDRAGGECPIERFRRLVPAK